MAHCSMSCLDAEIGVDLAGEIGVVLMLLGGWMQAGSQPCVPF